MEKKVKAEKMSEEEKKKVTEWFQEARSDRSLSRRSMEERYPLVYAMTDSNQQEPQQEEQLQKTETIHPLIQVKQLHQVQPLCLRLWNRCRKTAVSSLQLRNM